jgi:hypothetical protein
VRTVSRGAAQITLLVPGLQGPVGRGGAAVEEAARMLLEGLALPGLSQLLARADRPLRVAAGDTLEEMACWALDLPRAGAGRVPAGALSRHAVMDDAAGKVWLRADPVHLRPDMGKLILFPPASLDLSFDEAARITEWLNAHEHFPGPRLEPLSARCWCAALDSEPDMATVSPSVAHGHDAMAHLPTGPAAAMWHGRMNEVQMLLHACPVNTERERAGQPAVNSVWFWGAGELPAPAAVGFDGVCGDDELLRGAARWAGLRGEALPAAPAPWCAACQGRWLLGLDALDGPARAADPDAWRGALVELDREWFQPLAAAFSAGTLHRLVLCVGGGVGMQVSRRGLRRWWRRRQSPATAVAALRGAVQ